MHRGVRDYIRWLEDNRTRPDVSLQAPATLRDLTGIEHETGSPIPLDLRLVLGRFNGAQTPAGTLLTAAPGPGSTIEAALKEVAAMRGTSWLDPDILLPFARTEHGAILAFDRSAAPIADTWPIVDYDPESGEVRIVHRTFDGWCRTCVGEWNHPDFDQPFTLDRYIAAGRRHAEAEPDVSVAHVTVGHGLRRAGEPEDALASYLRGARCVPAVPWADWEAIKLAAILHDTRALLECATRLAKRTPDRSWEMRGTTPSRVAYLIARTLRSEKPEPRTQYLRAMDHLATQAQGEEDATAIRGIVSAIENDTEIPPPSPPKGNVVPPQADHAAWWEAMRASYAAGQLRDDDLALDPTYDPLTSEHVLGDLLRIRREF
ncbi:MAG: SMI1/KNR4 family protein [Sandaracinus sp.]